MKLNPYLNFNGQCETAFKFYEKCLGGRIVAMMTFGESPMAERMGPDAAGKIMHARLMVGEAVLMGSDVMMDYDKPQGFSVTLNVEDPAEAERVFTALGENAQVEMPIQETFWAQRFGMLVDQFGIPWMVNCEKKG